MVIDLPGHKLNLSCKCNIPFLNRPVDPGSEVGGGGSASGGSGSGSGSDAAVDAKAKAEAAEMEALKAKVELRTKMVDIVTNMALKQVTNVKDAEMAASRLKN